MAVQAPPSDGGRVGESPSRIDGGSSTRRERVMTEPTLRHIAGTRYVSARLGGIAGLRSRFARGDLVDAAALNTAMDALDDDDTVDRDRKSVV